MTIRPQRIVKCFLLAHIVLRYELTGNIVILIRPLFIECKCLHRIIVLFITINSKWHWVIYILSDGFEFQNLMRILCGFYSCCVAISIAKAAVDSTLIRLVFFFNCNQSCSLKHSVLMIENIIFLFLAIARKIDWSI